ncbi:hypothetical protein JCM3775_000582 [Rhodotorula graminis]|uniref:Alcohol dehydrogenase-like N-terminal domain-containing protein n=1 Tax=Rhodotorula graminis (strain WP1) TaxID=578459 RepID=A0A0P9IVT6_RHOGW|nr:uncharacterized protein RHOBADRAFT_45133 [Rhodotorula graminis WP1]KPV73841.1 hypothetical protein RHOBADRAFT_45133 [Rhodotorula graminis WP1]
MQSTMNIPDQFRAAQFTEKNGQLEIKPTQLGEVKADECVIKVHVCGLHSTDELLKHDLLPDMRYPMIPGGVVVGEIAKAAQQGKRNLKEGTLVVAITFMRGLAEYVAVNEAMVIELPKSFHSGDKHLEAPICAFDATRVWVAHERCHDELKRMNDAERRLVKDLNERMGFKGDGVLVVYGQGGFVKVALDTIKMAKQDRKVILVATSDRWSAGDYGLKDDCLVVVGKHNVADELKKLGGAQGIMCVDMPIQQVEQLLDGCRFHSSIVLLSPRQDQAMQLPIANILAKSMTLHGQPLVTHKQLEHAMQLADKHGLRAPVKQFNFDEGGVRQGWAAVEGREQFEAAVVVVSRS